METRWVIQWALTNAATVPLVAAVAAVVGRSLHRPALTHALWLLVLVKFVTPPLVGVPVPGDWLPDSVTRLARTHRPSGASEPPARRLAARQHTATLSPSAKRGHFAAPTAASDGVEASRPQNSLPAFGGNVLHMLAMCWLVGTVTYFLGVTARIARFSFRLRRDSVLAAEADARTSEIGRRLGLKRVPAVAFIAGACSPMLWGLGRFTSIVFPAALWNELSRPCRDALLTHELAHCRRRDHWVRPLEILVTGLFWWHPVLWYARREIERAEEACCDAWVVRQLSVAPRIYAEALLATVDYIASDSPSTIPAATGIGAAPDLKHRLRRIMQTSDSPVMPRFGPWILWTAGVLLPLHPFIGETAGRTTLASRPSPNGNPIVTTPAATADAQPRVPPKIEKDAAEDGKSPTGWWSRSAEERWAVARSVDARFRLLAAAGHRVSLEDRHTGRRTNLDDDQITAASFVPDSRHFVTGSLDGTVRLWDAASGEPQSFLGRHDAQIATVAVAPSGRFAASGSQDGSLLIWDLGSGAVWSTWTDPRRPIVSIRIASESRTIAVASGDWRSSEPARITLLDVRSNSLQPIRFLTLSETVAAIEFSAGDDALLAAAWDGTIFYWDLLGGNSFPIGAADRNVIDAATFSPDVRFADQVREPRAPPSAEWTSIADRPTPFPAPRIDRNQLVLPGVAPADRSAPDNSR